MKEEHPDLDQMCGMCGKDFEDCMCCECGDEDGKQYPEGIMCKECHDLEYFAGQDNTLDNEE